MNGRLKKILSILLICSMVAACLPVAALALPGRYEIDQKVIPESQEPIDPSGLRDGEIKTAVNLYTSADLSDTDFTVELSALGQKFQTTTTTTQKYNVVFVLDVSNSMDEGGRFDNMITAANSAIKSLQDKSGNDVKISIVAFATSTRECKGLTNNRLILFKSSSNNSYTQNGVDYIAVSRSNIGGGTNIQAGLNRAYDILRSASSSDAIPVIILLSDGAPTYYHTNLKDFRMTDRGKSGTGNTTHDINAAWTIAQAAYMKVKMPELQIYTIPFSLDSNDPDFNIATATLNPTPENLAKLSQFNTIWNSEIIGNKNIVPAVDAGKMATYYINGSYSASNSAASLTQALNMIIEEIQYKKPIQETTVHGALDEASYLKMEYRLGTGFTLKSENITVYLNGNSYLFSKGSGGEYTSSSPEMAGTRIEYGAGALTWLIPASALPCNSPLGDSQVLAEPIKLTFTMTFDFNAISDGGQYSAGTCYVEFTPVKDDPYYYVIDGKYYAATYPYPGSDNYGNSNRPKLTGFAVSFDKNSLNDSYIPNPAASTAVVSYTDKTYSSSYPSLYYGEPYTVYVDGNDRMAVSFEGNTIEFEGASRYKAKVSFTAANKSSASSYDISYFSDGMSVYSDAYVSAVTTSSNGNVDLTVSYDAGKRSVTFKNITCQYHSNYVDTNVTAKFRREYGFLSYTIKMIELNGKSVSGQPISYSGGFFDTSFDIYATINGTDYIFNDVYLSWLGDSNSSVITAKKLNTYYSGQAEQYYYYTELTDGYQTSGPYNDYEFIYDSQAGTLTVRMWDGTKWITDGPYTAGETTTIRPNNKNGYTVTRINKDGTGIEVTEYFVENNKLVKRAYNAKGANGVDITSGKVSYTHTDTGYLVVSEVADPEEWAEECGASAELWSTSKTPYAMADSGGTAYIYLYFTVEKDFKAIEITLNLNGFTSEAVELMKYEGGSYKGSFLHALTDPDVVLTPGSYRIKYKLSYSNMAGKPDTVKVTFGQMYFISEGYEALLKYDASNPLHSVNVSMTATAGH